MSNPVDKAIRQLRFGPPESIFSTLPTLAQMKQRWESQQQQQQPTDNDPTTETP